MDLYVIRHAIAEERTSDKPDAARELTRKGRRRFRSIIRGLDDLNVELAVILHSPWARAAETAQLSRRLLAGGGRDALIATDALTDTPSDALVELIGSHAATGPVGVIGHEPWLTELVGLLAFADARAARGLALKKGGVIHLDGDAVRGGMTIRALYPPSALRAID